MMRRLCCLTMVGAVLAVLGCHPPEGGGGGAAAATQRPRSSGVPSQKDWRAQPKRGPYAGPVPTARVEAAPLARGTPVRVSGNVHVTGLPGGVELHPKDWNTALVIRFKTADGVERIPALQHGHAPMIPAVAGTRDASYYRWLDPVASAALPLGDAEVWATLDTTTATKGWVGKHEGPRSAFTVVDGTQLTPGEAHLRHLSFITFYTETGAHAQAIAHSKLWVTEEPDAFYSHVALGMAHLHAGEKAAALASLDQAFKLFDHGAPVREPPEFFRVRKQLKSELR